VVKIATISGHRAALACVWEERSCSLASCRAAALVLQGPLCDTHKASQQLAAAANKSSKEPYGLEHVAAALIDTYTHWSASSTITLAVPPGDWLRSCAESVVSTQQEVTPGRCCPRCHCRPRHPRRSCVNRESIVMTMVCHRRHPVRHLIAAHTRSVTCRPRWV
jgi:hypothetical protein